MENKEINLPITVLNLVKHFLTVLPSKAGNIPVKVWLDISKNNNMVTAILDPAVKLNDDLVRKYGTTEEDGKIHVRPNNPNYEVWKKENEELSSQMESFVPYMIEYEQLKKMGTLPGIPGILEFMTHFVTEPIVTEPIVKDAPVPE